MLHLWLSGHKQWRGESSEWFGKSAFDSRYADLMKSFGLNAEGNAIVAAKTGGALFTKNRATVYPAVQAVTAMPIGAKAGAVSGTRLRRTLSSRPVIVPREN